MLHYLTNDYASFPNFREGSKLVDHVTVKILGNHFIEDDIICNSYYLINKVKKKKKPSAVVIAVNASSCTVT